MGLDCLRNGDFEKAHQHLALVNDALDRLAEPFPNSARYRQAFRELEIVVRLQQIPLEESLDDANSSLDTLSAMLKGRTIMIEADVEPNPTGGWTVGYSTFRKDQPVTIHSQGLTLFAALKLIVRTRLIFGARIEGLVTTESGGTALKLEPDSGVLMTDPMIFGQLGLAWDDEAASIRGRQQSLAEQLYGYNSTSEAADAP